MTQNSLFQIDATPTAPESTCPHPADCHILTRNLFAPRQFDLVCSLCNGTIAPDYQRDDSPPACDECRSNGPHCAQHGRHATNRETPVCENHPKRDAAGIDGNESPLCIPCLVDSHEYAKSHAPESAGPWSTYLAECAARLHDTA